MREVPQQINLAYRFKDSQYEYIMSTPMQMDQDLDFHVASG